MWLLAVGVALLGADAPPPVHPDALRPWQIVCLGEKTVVGISGDSHLIRYDGSRWQTSGLAETTVGLWRAPDGRVFTSNWRLVVEVREPFQLGTRWHLREEGPLRVIARGKELLVASPRALYKLDPTGTITFEGVTPVSRQVSRPYIPPVLLDSELGTIICTGSSATEANPIRGHCVGPYRHPYSYRAEFGMLAWPDEGGGGTEPFVCSDVVLSAHKNGTQARRVSDGVQIGRAALYASSGSRCLPNGRAFLVGRREVGVFDLPQLRPVWRHPLPAKTSDAILCGSQVVVLSSRTPTLATIDVPADVLRQ